MMRDGTEGRFLIAHAWRWLFVLGLLVFGGLKLFSLEHSDSDENIYLYLADRMSEGALPHLDFFHAHPPLHLLPMALIFLFAGGFSLGAARLFAFVVVCGAAIALYRMLARRSPAEALIACVLFLFCFDILRLSTHFVGANLATLWVAIGLERLARRRDLQAAIAFALGGFTLPSAAPAAVGAAAVVLLLDRRRGLGLILMGGGIFLALNAIALALFGAAFVEQVYLFHLGKQANPAENLRVFRSIFSTAPWLMGGSLLGLMSFLIGADATGESRDQSNEKSAFGGLRAVVEENAPLFLSLGAAVGSIVFLILTSRVFVYYFEVLLLCLAPLAAFGFACWLRCLHRVIRAPTRDGLVAAGVLSVVFLASQVPLLNLAAGRDADQKLRHHTWRGSGAPFVDALARPFFRNGEERVGRRYVGLTRYLWHEADVFESADRLAKKVSEVCAPDEVIFGDSTSAPLVALLAERRLFRDMADTNRMRFEGKPERIEALIASLESDPPCAIVYRDRHGLFHLERLKQWLVTHYAPALHTEDAGGLRSYRLYVPRSGGAD